MEISSLTLGWGKKSAAEQELSFALDQKVVTPFGDIPAGMTGKQGYLLWGGKGSVRPAHPQRVLYASIEKFSSSWARGLCDTLAA